MPGGTEPGHQKIVGARNALRPLCSHAREAGGCFHARGRSHRAHRRPVVARPDDKCLAIDAEFPQLVEQLSGRPVELFNRITPGTIGTLATEVGAGRRGSAARHGLRQVQKEWLISIRFHKFDRAFGEPFR